MRRSLPLAVLLLLPAVARADGLPGSGSYAMDRVYTYAGCADDGSACFRFGFHVGTVMDPYGLGPPEQWVLYDYFDVIFLDGSTDPWRQYAPFSGMNRYCLGAFEGVASAEWTMAQGNGGCENALPEGSTWAPGETITTSILMRPDAEDYERRGITMTTTPEPASLVLMGTGLVGLAGAVRRKRRQH